MSVWKWVALGATVLAVLPVLVLVVGQAGLLRGTPPADFGVRDGRLRPPSPTPNSVSSQADLWPDHPQRAYARIAPLALPATRLPGASDADRMDALHRGESMARLRAVIEAMPGARVVAVEDGYLRAEFDTRWLRFTDDAEFWLDRERGVFQVRSASRLGRRDMGVNRRRIEAIRAALAGG